MIIENGFFLVAGVLALFFALGHALWGLRMILPDLHASEMPVFTRHMLAVIWQQPTVFHFLAAVAFVIASAAPHEAGTDPLVAFIGLVTLGFLLNYVATSFVRNRAALAQIIPQALAVLVYLGIIAAGISM